MEDDRTLLVGFDLCDDYSQISSFHKNFPEPESVCITPDKTKYLIPTALCLKESTGEWLIAEEAQRCRDREAGCYVDQLLTHLEKEDSINVYGTSYTGSSLMEKYFRKVLGILRQRFLNNSILQLVVTLKNPSTATVEKLYEILNNLGLGKDRVRIISHTISFMYYTISQAKDIWTNDVALFDYDKDGLFYYQLTFGRKKMPIAIVAERTDLSGSISFDMLEVKPIERLKFNFESTANLTLHKKIVSSLFITGRGFEGNWSDDVLRSLCMGRRVFKGQNLYTKGACYAARAIQKGTLSDFVFLAEEVSTNSIAMKVYYDAKPFYLPMAEAGEQWQQIDKSCFVILDDCQELEFIVTDVLKKESMREVLSLDGLIRRENKTIRLELRLSFLDRNTAVIKIKDVGFGEFYPTNYRIWEQIIRL